MDSFELSKIAGAVLCAALAIVLPRTLAEMTSEGHGEHAKEAGYILPSGEAAPTKAAAAAGAPAADADAFSLVKPLLAAAKAENGVATFKICQACHSGDKGGANKVGPVLWGVVGRKQGSVDGFAYSEGMKAKGSDWSYEHLADFLSNPKGYVTGTKMSFAGVKDPAQLADLLAYLGTLSDAPVPLPK